VMARAAASAAREYRRRGDEWATHRARAALGEAGSGDSKQTRWGTGQVTWREGWLLQDG